MKRLKNNLSLRRLINAAFRRTGSIAITVPVTLLVALTVVIGTSTAVDIYQAWSRIEPTERAQVGITLIQTIATIVGGLAIFWNIILARKQLSISHDQSITDRFFKAVEQLGHEQSAVRVGSIYALGRIAHDSFRDHGPVVEVLAFHIRDKRSFRCADEIKGHLPNFDRDIGAAIMVLGRRNVQWDQKPIYLTYCDLRSIGWWGHNFNNTKFHYSVLSQSNFTNTQLERTNFSYSDLSQANLQQANLQDATLVHTNFHQANLTGCILTHADILGANFREAQGLTVEQILSTQNWQAATYDPEFLMQLQARCSPGAVGQPDTVG